MSLTSPDRSCIRSLGELPERLEHVSGPVSRVMADVSVKMAARALVDRDVQYVGPNIVIPTGSHGEALRLVRELRAALEIGSEAYRLADDMAVRG